MGHSNNTWHSGGGVGYGIVSPNDRGFGGSRDIIFEIFKAYFCILTVFRGREGGVPQHSYDSNGLQISKSRKIIEDTLKILL